MISKPKFTTQQNVCAARALEKIMVCFQIKKVFKTKVYYVQDFPVMIMITRFSKDYDYSI